MKWKHLKVEQKVLLMGRVSFAVSKGSSNAKAFKGKIRAENGTREHTF